jgi:uncharacterized membrane protein
MKRIRNIFSYTEAELRSTLAGVNLFFGALLGAHLGTMSRVPIYDYVFLIMLLAGAVTVIFMVASSTRARLVWFTVGLYVLIFAAIISIPEMRPRHMENEIQRIVAMLAVWLVFIVSLRLAPVHPEPGAQAGGGPLPVDDEA